MIAALVTALAGCAPTSKEPGSAAELSRPSGGAKSPGPFPTAAFGDISDAPVSDATAVKYQAILADMAGGGGMAATVMAAGGSWSGATGKADGVHDVEIDSQFGIASVTKAVVAAQVMVLVEVGELSLDDPAANHLPTELDFDANGATIRQLLGMRSGIPDYDDALVQDDGSLSPVISTDPRRRWSPSELLHLVGAERAPAGAVWDYSSTNYLLLGLIIEHVRGRPLANVLRDGVLRGDGQQRLIYQPDEAPTAPMAMPGGRSTDVLQNGGGFLPSRAESTAGHGAFAMASDSVSLARWWRALCAGEIVSRASLTEMATFPDSNRYGLGVFDIAEGYATSIGHAGWSVGYVAWAACLPDDGAVVVVLKNGAVPNIAGMARPLVEALHSD